MDTLQLNRANPPLQKKFSPEGNEIWNTKDSNLVYYINDNYLQNNILTSLFYAEKELSDDVIILYSDIIFEKKLMTI